VTRVKNRAGFTLVEAIVGLTLLGVVLSVTLAALNVQVRQSFRDPGDPGIMQRSIR
jgi:prepilin-type N-terminal cleavage/methylation domain-containing protein